MDWIERIVKGDELAFCNKQIDPVIALGDACLAQNGWF
jgi:hypothetical protein